MCDIKALSNSGIEKNILSFVNVQQSPRFNIDIIHYENGCGEISFNDDDKRGYEKVILCFQKPVNIIEFQKCREYVIDHGASEIKAFIYDKGVEDKGVEEVKEKIIEECTKWCKEPPREDDAFKIKEYVEFPAGENRDSTSHLYTSAMIGKMGDLLLQLRKIAKEYVEELKENLGKKSLEDRFNEIRDAVSSDDAKKLGNKSLEDHFKKCRKAVSSDAAGSDDSGDKTPALPKILLLGDSGVGKSLITNFLHECLLKYLKKEGNPKLPEKVVADSHHPVRIVIPEFLQKADDFEYRLFGYVNGSFTGANENGDIGLLAQNIGQVVFLDEIGTADANIQAKLLAYLDDYKIRPRGWQQAPFLCPTLVVAATNEKERIYDNNQFRNDLLARFTNILEIPNLKERIAENKETFKYILDCVIQNDNMKITSVGKDAWEVLWNHFSQGCSGNFRELETWIREACRNAMDDKREQLIAKDFEPVENRGCASTQKSGEAEGDIQDQDMAATFQVRKNSTWAGREDIIIAKCQANPQASADRIYEILEKEGVNGSQFSVRRFIAKYRQWLKSFDSMNGK